MLVGYGIPWWTQGAHSPPQNATARGGAATHATTRTPFWSWDDVYHPPFPLKASLLLTTLQIIETISHFQPHCAFFCSSAKKQSSPCFFPTTHTNPLITAPTFYYLPHTPSKFFPSFSTDHVSWWITINYTLPQILGTRHHSTITYSYRLDLTSHRMIQLHLSRYPPQQSQQQHQPQPQQQQQQLHLPPTRMMMMHHLSFPPSPPFTPP